MAELADAYGLGPYIERCGGSSPSIRMKILIFAVKKNKIIQVWRRSSGVEQRTHKPLVGGSIPPVAIFYFKK